MKSPVTLSLVIALSLASPARALLLAPVQVVPTKPAVAAPPPLKAAPAQAVVTTFAATDPADKLAIVSFVSVPSPVPPGTEHLTLRVTFKNTSTVVQRAIRVLISRTGATVLETNSDRREMTVPEIAPGASKEVDFNLAVATYGNRRYVAAIRGDHATAEGNQQLRNNELELNLTIPPYSNHIVTQVLDYEKAKRAGAQFLQTALKDPKTGIVGSCPVFGQFYDPTNAVAGPPPMPFSVRFRVDCAGSNGIRGNVEAFGGFRLKHRWKVKSVDKLQEANHDGHVQWVAQPTHGSDDPKVSAELSAGRGGSAHVIVRVTIEGPEGSDPYQ